MRYWISAIVVASIIGVFWLSNGDKEPAIEYQTQAITTGAIESVVNTAGSTKAVVTVEVGTEVSGLITKLHVDFNDQVKQGQAIAQLDDRSYQARLRQTQADVTMAKANLAQQEAGLTKSNAELARAERALKRQQQLIASSLSNQTELDNAVASFDTAVAQVALSKALIQSAQAQLLQRDAQLEQAQLDLDRTIIRSPVNGTVIDRQVDIGQTVAASLSAPTLFTIAQDLSQMQIEADVDEADIGKIEQGQAVKFQVDAFPERQFRGQVQQVRKAASNVANVVTYKVIIDAPNQQQLLLPGMTANLNIIRGQKQDILRVPNSALRFKPTGIKTDTNQPRQTDMADKLISELKLSGEKADKVKQLITEFQKNLQQAFAQSNSAGPMQDRRQIMQQQRQKMQNALQQVLTAEEFATYSQLMAQAREQRQQGNNGTAAQVWKLGADGVPYAVDIRVGLADDEYSEVLGNALTADDKVIVRAVRAN
ncbi:efflux RND transporter periplasmic adaptor subunit [Rheinheimera sp. MMS21-TC3]|uniref:efflux RND transporter periplasmic adaptor subunit n=1 Tax=Rheinheimera sp. MMS21-TC3 TaxID=3072790 RepID=UPI0028C4E812|nr:efflux RND transporter periplasmic adaptor subunit [Rheinheimera sp. MMS21-TC3]WNO61757.1 efflux RND transporter periplasmic adaptor subunit [Rheinheimera sp. MMS21-TC3]